ncbi:MULTISPECIES: hypothetical protein [Pectobacterium]|uniref:hypothetical protein n=1 Tax=Pectobacterium TaxID=122277 RepID=UPI001CF20400|nr:hypothetical protein [Pectobacterium odoriferum]MCA6962279.1 hypothetical protein [Pectobacterium odoriferum]MCH5010378.1 hypothetical protein [Pectobacterium odoriferum]
MSSNIGIIIGIVGLLFASPALIYAFRLLFRIGLSFLWPEERLVLNYTNKDGEKFQKKLKINKNDEIFRALDEIAKNKNAGKTHNG